MANECSWSKPALAIFKPEVIPFYEGKKGWGGLFGIDYGYHREMKSANQLFPDSYWYRIEYAENIFFAYAESRNGELRSDHRHSDLGSFIFYYNGCPIFY